MNLLNLYTPKGTKEVAEGIFAQETSDGSLRPAFPMQWEGAIVWSNVRKHLFRILFILFIIFAYVSDTGNYREFYEYARGDPAAYCAEYEASEIAFKDVALEGLDDIILGLYGEGGT